MKRKGVLEFSVFIHSEKIYNHDIEMTAFLCNENSHTGIHYFGQLLVDSEVWSSNDCMGFQIWGELICTEIKISKSHFRYPTEQEAPIVCLVQELQDMFALQAGRIPQAMQDTVEKIKWCLIPNYSWGMTLILTAVCMCPSCLSSHLSQQISQYCKISFEHSLKLN